MRNFSKMLLVLSVCSFCFAGIHTHASTGTVTTTGTIAYSGAILDYLKAQRQDINTSFDASYSKLYAIFGKTGLNIIKSVDYQTLVCLGAIKDQSLLSQLQKDKISFKLSFTRDFNEIENQILDLEEKYKILQEDGINLFNAGTSYASEKARIKESIDAKAKLNKAFITNFEKTYLAKNTDFLSSFQQYNTVNKDLVKGITDNVAKVQKVLNAFAEVETIVTKIHAKIAGLDDLIKKMEEVKKMGLNNLDKVIQPLIDTNVKTYKRIQSLTGELTKQKMYVVGQYQMDIDEYMTKNLQSRYNRDDYLALKTSVESFKAKFYTGASQINCANILSSTDEGTALLAKIATMKIAVNSGWVKIDKEGINTTLKNQLYSGFQALYIQKFKQRYAEYTTYLKNNIKTALKNFVSSTTSTTTSNDDVVSTPIINTTYIFTKPFKSGQYSEDIKALQNVLTTLGWYKGAIDGIYSKDTKEAVYQFQVSKGLLKGYENKPDVRGYFGPATRNAINNINK